MGKINLAVIFGGDSVEHEVSVISALQAIENIDIEKYNVLPIYIAKDRTMYYGKMLAELEIIADFENLKKFATKVNLIRKDNIVVIENQKGFRKQLEIDLVFPIVHGKNIEDGSLIGLLEMLNIPYIGSGILGSAIAQDKIMQKQVLASLNLPVVDYIWFNDYEYFDETDEILKNIENLSYPVIVKPASLGSSVGIKVVKTSKDIKSAIEDAINYDSKIIIEKLVPNLKEINCAVIGNNEKQETSFLQEMYTVNELLTYNDKYIGGGKGKVGKFGKTGKFGSKDGKAGFTKLGVGMDNASFTVPAKIEKKLEEKIYDLSINTFKALNLAGVVRIDFLIDTKTNQVYINEPNVIPGSLSFFLFTPKGKTYSKLIDELVNYAIKDFKNKQSKTSSFDTNILKYYSNLGGVKGKLGN